MKKKKKRLVFVFALIALVCLYFTARYGGLTIRKYTIKTNKLSEPIRIVLITDLHSVYFGQEQEELITKIERQHPNIILMAGDIADDKTPHEGTIDLLKGVAHKYPCYYVSGNHEFWSGEIDDIKAMFLKYGVRVLEGENVTVAMEGQAINICGIDDPEIGEEAFLQQIDDAMNKNNNELYTILLTHRPERIKTYLEYDCDLVLSGHTHGGLWRVPFIINGLYAPDQGYFPKYGGGKYGFSETVMIVGRGIKKNTGKYPRIFNPSEIVVVDIVPD